MPLIRFPTVKGLVYTIDLSKIADRENPRTVEAPIPGSYPQYVEPYIIDWGDGQSTPVNSAPNERMTHTYAAGAGDVFTIVIRSATGHLPIIAFNGGDGASATVPSLNLSLALVSTDHFAGWTGNASISSGGSLYRICSNVQYVDTRLIGLPKWSSLSLAFRGAAELYQPVGSFCFDFLSICTSAEGVFYGCGKLYGSIPVGFMDGFSAAGNLGYFFASCANLTGGIPADLFDKCISVTSFNNTFAGCYRLTPPPCIFWMEDGSFDTDKFPHLSSASNCYNYCSADMRAQVPTAYGGTMTVG